MNITIIGVGYVGLVSGACFAEIGHNVTCLDINKSKINSLKKSKVPFYEPGLSEIISKNIKRNKIHFTTSYKKSCKNNLIFICVDTPDDGNGVPNLNSIKNVMRSLSSSIYKDTLIVTKSTVPIGVNRSLEALIRKLISNDSLNISIASNPEFLREGSAIDDFMSPERLIVGYNEDKDFKKIKNLYTSLKLNENQIIGMSLESAELTKYAANVFLATKISFINEISQIAEKSGASIDQVKAGIGSDSRIGSKFLNSGIGYGGSCFPKDVNALINTKKYFKLGRGIIESTKSVNDAQLNYFYKKIKNRYGKDLKNKNIAIWGLTFKPETDDLRESVAIKLINMLHLDVKYLNLYDPMCKKSELKNQLKLIKNYKLHSNKYSALKNTTILIICTEWEEFKNVNLNNLQHLNIFDGRNIFNKDELNLLGIEYNSIGR